MKELILLLSYHLLGVVCPGFSGATACADENGEVLGEVACSGAMQSIHVTPEMAVAEVSKEAAWKFVEACQKAHPGKVCQVGKKLSDCKMEFVPYTVVEGDKKTKLDSKAALEAYKKPPPPLPPVKKAQSDAAEPKLPLVAMLTVTMLAIIMNVE